MIEIILFRIVVFLNRLEKLVGLPVIGASRRGCTRHLPAFAKAGLTPAAAQAAGRQRDKL
jgi:hypothetical protein